MYRKWHFYHKLHFYREFHLNGIFSKFKFTKTLDFDSDFCISICRYIRITSEKDITIEYNL